MTLSKEQAYALLCAINSFGTDRDEQGMRETGLRQFDRDTHLDCPRAHAAAYFSAIAGPEENAECDMSAAEYWEPEKCDASELVDAIERLD